MTIREMLQRYLTEVSVTKASHKTDLSRVKLILVELGDFRVHILTAIRVAHCKADRLALVGRKTSFMS